jgi:ferredoxin
VSGLEIRIDRDACSGARACTLRAPNSFALDAGRKAVLVDAQGDPEEALLAAARSCPNFAIELSRNRKPVG